MRRILLLMMLAVAVGSVRAQELTAERTATPEEKEILTLEHDRIKATAEGGEIASNWYADHWADSMVMTLQDGSIRPKSLWVTQFRSGFSVLFQDHYDYHVRVYNGNTAVVTYLGWARSGLNYKPESLQGQISTMFLNSYHHSAITDVWIRQDGKWLTVVHHVTNIPTGQDEQVRP